MKNMKKWLLGLVSTLLVVGSLALPVSAQTTHLNAGFISNGTVFTVTNASPGTCGVGGNGKMLWCNYLDGLNAPTLEHRLQVVLSNYTGVSMSDMWVSIEVSGNMCVNESLTMPDQTIKVYVCSYTEVPERAIWTAKTTFTFIPPAGFGVGVSVTEEDLF